MPDTYNLQRFIDAQHNYNRIREELINGKKISHWMWFIFPQITGLGKSHTAQYYAIKSKAEAQAYLTHPILGKRLVNCTKITLSIKNSSAREIFGYPDYLKFHSCMTLFSSIENNEFFDAAIDKYYSGIPDYNTTRLIENL